MLESQREKEEKKESADVSGGLHTNGRPVLT